MDIGCTPRRLRNVSPKCNHGNPVPVSKPQPIFSSESCHLVSGCRPAEVNSTFPYDLLDLRHHMRGLPVPKNGDRDTPTPSRYDHRKLICLRTFAWRGLLKVKYQSS